MSYEVHPLSWRTSSYSGNASGNCVEVALDRSVAHIRDTKQRHAGGHAYTAVAWNALRQQLHRA